MITSRYYGGIEAGGTKFVCVVGTDEHEIIDEIRIPTGTPDETIRQAIDFFKRQLKKYTLSAIGIGSFGPVDLDPNSSTYGHITSSPKVGWQNIDFGRRVSRALQLPIVFDTDANAAALAEYQWGAARGLDTFIYITIGTGIGGGGMSNGKLMHGLSHPEMGHCFIPLDNTHDQYNGKCPYHGNRCFEGLASGPAITERWGISGELLPKNHQAWPLEAHYIALGLVNFITIFSPQKIILGGGVMQQIQLFPMIRDEVQQLLNGYINIPAITDTIDPYIVPASFDNKAGVLGVLALAQHVSHM